MAKVCASCVQTNNIKQIVIKDMKKGLLMLFGCLFALAIQAQSEHLKFMGIPLDGKINDFQSQLLKKGCTLDEFFMKYVKFPNLAFSIKKISELSLLELQ